MRPRWIALLVAGAALAFAAVVLAATRAHHEANDLRGSASGPASHFNGALLPFYIIGLIAAVVWAIVKYTTPAR